MNLKKILTGFMVAFALIGCSTEENKKENPHRKISGAVISEKPKEFTIFALHLGKAFNGELPVFKKAFEMTNIKLKGTASKNQSDEVLAFKLMLSSGELPDIIAYEYPEELEKLGADGKVIPLEDLIEKYAPNIKKFWEENPKYKKDAVAADGHIYMIPNYNDYDSISTSQGYYIRKDWLKKLGLKEPETSEELYTVLKAFREQDPNGNGLKDEIPIFLRGNTSKKIISSLIDIFEAEYNWYVKNGKPVFGPGQPEYKKAVRELAKWYKEGLIDSEVFTRDTSSRDYVLNNNLGGFTCDWFSSTGNYNSKLKEAIPGFDFSVILPVEYNGTRSTAFSRENYLGGWSISKTAKDPVDIIKYFDFWYTEEGRRLWNFGIEGEDYVMVDGKPKFTDKVLKNPEGRIPLMVLRETGAQYRLGMFQDGENERQWADPEAVKAMDLYIKSGVVKPPMPILKYTKEEVMELSKIDAQLYSIAEEMTQKCILGVSDVDKEWGSYIRRLNSAGRKRAEEIQKQAYERFMKK